MKPTAALVLLALAVGCGKDNSTSAAAAAPPGNAPAVAGALTEKQKIEKLIAAVGTLKDARFIRNGKQYSTGDAMKHMRKKWKWKSDDIKTAEDFIRLAASQSTVSGKPYTIRFADGKEVKSGDWLRERLKEMENPEPPGAQGNVQ